MPEYRLYFLDPDDHIEACHDFVADHDMEAWQLAAILADACSEEQLQSSHFRLARSRRLLKASAGLRERHQTESD